MVLRGLFLPKHQHNCFRVGLLHNNESAIKQNNGYVTYNYAANYKDVQINTFYMVYQYL